MSETAVVVRGNTDVAMTSEMSVAGVMQQVQLIQQIMSKCMIDKEHYGTIPGCGEKKTLLKSGAEKLTLTFRMAPDYEIETLDHPHGHQEYRVKCKMSHIGTGNFLGSGVGCASTMETKWRFRKTTTPTGEPIPKDYKENKGAYAAKGLTCRKNDAGVWEWCKIERTEHDNPADNYNTCLKMAKKRALVDAVLTCTAASDIFTQDLEEMVENGVIQASETPAASKPPVAEPQARKQASTPPPAGAGTSPKVEVAPPPPPPAHAPAPAKPVQPPPRAQNEAREPGGEGLGENEVLMTMPVLRPAKTKTGKSKWIAKAEDGQWYTVWSGSDADLYNKYSGQLVIIEFQPTEWGPNILNVRLPDPVAEDTTANSEQEPREQAEGEPMTGDDGEPLPF